MYFPKNKSIWTMGQMLNKKEVPAYAFEDFWSRKPRWTHWFYKILSHMIAPIAAYIFNNADTIAVYKDTRIITTFKQSIKKLNVGNNIVIFPENRVEFNEIINKFQDKFIDVAKLYYKKYNKELYFVPMYYAKTKLLFLVNLLSLIRLLKWKNKENKFANTYKQK